jgi:nicotinamide phosphoribosyltransferase
MNINPLTAKDYYKADHRSQYPEGTELVYSNMTPRSTKYAPKAPGVNDSIVVFGLQVFIKEFLMDTFDKNFFKQPKEKVIKQYKRRMDTSLGPDSISMEHIAALHDLGYLPISIRALPEGSVVDARVPVYTIENTKPEFFWLTNFLETIASNMTWKMATSATTAYKYRQLLTRYARETGGDENFVPFQAHDFSFRGMNGIWDASSSGAGHLISFVGTDTIPAIDFLEEFYNADAEKELIGCSVPATEHSVMCMGGKETEIETFRRLITKVYPKGIVSIVSDTWDFWSVVRPGDGILAKLKNEILARKGGAVGDKVVIRPDSGDPVKIIVGDPDAPVGSCEYKGAIECLWETFGGTKTAKGYRVLNSHIGLIYGDSITLERCYQIVNGLKKKGFASTNVVLGVGSYTYTYTTRDTYGYAVKATAGAVNGQLKEIFKDPKTDSGMKKSAKGFLAIKKDAFGKYFLKDCVSREEAYNDTELKEVFRDGKLLVDHKLADIRARLLATIQ